MSSHFKCNIFEQTIEDTSSFSFVQQELKFDPLLSKERASFRIEDVTYNCKFEKRDFVSDRPTLLIPINNHEDLLKFTISNLKEQNVINLANVLVIDDRSTDDLAKVCEDENVSYLRIDNEKGFNFSVINNVGAKLCQDLGNDTVIMWNSDLWCAKEEYFKELLSRHKKNNSKVSGTKLVYPPSEMSLHGEYDNQNIRNHFPNLLGVWREKIQFGGDDWMPVVNQKGVPLLPIHARRFKEIDDPIASTDKPIHFTTGALQVWDLNYFIELGGFNPSLAKSFQDVDICLRSVKEGNYPWYFGNDLYFYHDESLSLSSEGKESEQFVSDNVLFMRIWQNLQSVIL